MKEKSWPIPVAMRLAWNAFQDTFAGGGCPWRHYNNDTKQYDYNRMQCELKKELLKLAIKPTFFTKNHQKLP
jgi:hypothetical protein